MRNLHRQHYLIIAIWFIANLLQSIFTGLHSDESYYWMYSQNPAWGYFDHPPLVAGLIIPGHWMLPGEIGVRLLFIIISTFTLALILNELNEQKDFWFLAIFIASFPLLHTHIAGFMAIPDIPLLLLTMLFLILYRKFIINPGAGLSVLLAITVSAMIYSKYHAFLIIGLTVLSNPKLLRNKYFYLTAAIALILLIPHIKWQIENEIPTLKYHFVERAKPFRLKYVFPNLINQLVMAGPLTGILVFLKFSRFQIRDLFDRALVFNIVGFYIIFFLLSFKNRIEAHWTAAIIPMLMIIVYPLISGDPKIKLWFKRLALPVLVLFIIFRIYIAMDIIPNIGKIKITFYNREEHALEINKLADGRKVGFFNNYAAISNYIFYSGDSAVHLSTPDYRYCQYDLWNDEEYAEGYPIFAVQSKHLNPPNLTRMSTGQMKGFFIIEKFQSLEGVDIKIKDSELSGQKLQLTVQLTNRGGSPVFTVYSSEPSLCVMQDKTEIYSVQLKNLTESDEILQGETIITKIEIPINEISLNVPVTVYTRSKENYRGKMASFKPGARAKL